MTADYSNHYTHGYAKNFSNASSNYLSFHCLSIKTPLAEPVAIIYCVILPLNSDFNLFSNLCSVLTSVNNYLLNDFSSGSMLNAEITGKKSAVSSGPPNNHNTVAHPDV